MRFLHEAELIQRVHMPDGKENIVKLSGADLRSGALRYIDLKNAAWNGADLKGADLGRAKLKSADLSGADLEGAHLEGADLWGATGLAQEQIERAYGEERTKLPKGLHLPEAWSKNFGLGRKVAERLRAWLSWTAGR